MKDLDLATVRKSIENAKKKLRFHKSEIPAWEAVLKQLRVQERYLRNQENYLKRKNKNAERNIEPVTLAPD